jgi:hypothetical protein
MNIESRVFRFKTFLLLIPETEYEKSLLDMLGKTLDKPLTVPCEVTSDDSFNPYLRIEIGKKQ